MQTYFPKRLIAISECLTQIRLASMTDHEGAWHIERKNVKKSLQRIIDEVEFMGLKLTRIYAERFLSELEGSSQEQAEEKVAVLDERFNDELASVVLFIIPQEKLDYFQNSNLFGNAVAARFPRANYEAAEAGKCFAIGRYTACVFHLMRIMEVALRTIARELNIPNPTTGANRNWGNMLRQVKDKIDDNNRQMAADPVWQQGRTFYENTYAYLEGVRQPWRNSTMHVEVNYEEEGARDILNATGALMRHLSTKLAE